MAIDESKVLQNAMDWLPSLFAGEATGHDWQHTLRVYRSAKAIAEAEAASNPGLDRFAVALAALLHDADDRKVFGDGCAEALTHARLFLSLNGVEKNRAEQICVIIKSVSFSSGLTPQTAEGKIVQDADRLDALGAIGIARTFAYGGSRQRPIYNPDNALTEVAAFSPDEYKMRKGSSVDHFYEKLLRLKDLMNTDAGRRMTEQRHLYMLGFLDEFYAEWNGKA